MIKNEGFSAIVFITPSRTVIAVYFNILIKTNTGSFVIVI